MIAFFFPLPLPLGGLWFGESLVRVFLFGDGVVGAGGVVRLRVKGFEGELPSLTGEEDTIWNKLRSLLSEIEDK